MQILQAYASRPEAGTAMLPSPDESLGEVLEVVVTVRYDRETDTLTVIFREGQVAERDVENPAVVNVAIVGQA